MPNRTRNKIADTLATVLRYVESCKAGCHAGDVMELLGLCRKAALGYLHALEAAGLVKVAEPAQGSWPALWVASKREGALAAKLQSISSIVGTQAEDQGIWFQAETSAEAYMQQELRKLHAAVEGE